MRIAAAPAQRVLSVQKVAEPSTVLEGGSCLCRPGTVVSSGAESGVRDVSRNTARVSCDECGKNMCNDFLKVI